MTMGMTGQPSRRFAETTSFLNYFNNLPDYHQAGKVDYPLPEALLLILLARFWPERKRSWILHGLARRSLLRRFLPFLNGTPAHDHLGDISRVRSTPGRSRPASPSIAAS
jgi:hypothetical protein